MDELEGYVRFHHLLPGLRVMEARACAHRWVVFHETYDFCLVTKLARGRVDWKYNHRLYTVDREHVIMAMQPGELHANTQRTQPGDFIVVQVAEPLMRRFAEETGCASASLDLPHPQPASTDPALRRALEAFKRALCNTSYGDDRAVCVCGSTPGIHAENLLGLVHAFVQGCKGTTRREPPRITAPALVRRARDYLVANHAEPYNLESLTRECGSDAPFYLLHAFKEAFDVSPGEFRRRVLVAKTCEALAREPARPLEMIARDVGWTGDVDDAPRANTVIRHFRRTLGITPDRFRHALRAQATADWRRRANEAIVFALGAHTSGTRIARP